MKHILLAGLLSFGSVASPVFAEPASAQSQMESIQDMAVWMQSMTTIEVDLASLFSADSMSNLFAAINSSDAFEVETQMLKAMNASYELYMSDKSDEKIQSSIDENDLAFFPLVQERTKLMQQRLSLLQ